jgi:penicillin amidase
LIRPLLAALALIVLTTVSTRRLGPVPPMGPFLDPVNGVWAVATSAELPSTADGRVQGLADSVVVVYDHRRVPHIFAATEEDAARALGYVVARDRLFQLELQSRMTEGTLAELAGRVALRLDRSQRALGLAWSARRQMATLDTTGQLSRLAAAYADGVNAWIATLGPRDVPLEYRLFGARPRRWEPVYTLYLMREMGNTLTYSALEQVRERVAAAVGDEATDALFPVHSPIQEPIVPAAHDAYPRFERTPLPAPRVGDGRIAGHRSPEAQRSEPDGAPLASNNWAVAPARSATGHALLAGDPHLGLTLPSIWYEAHVAVPGTYDVYGVTFPGSPSIIIGFNRDVAWTFTNTGADVVDYYEETLDNAEHPAAYLVDGEWRPLESRIEVFRGPDGKSLETDTIYHTHRGPLRTWTGDRRVSMRWTTLDNGNTADAIYRATHATTVHDWLTAMRDHDAAPQNGLVADRAGNIAILSAGLYPRRLGGAVGTRVWDGSSSASDWLGYWTPEERPQIVNPPRGFLASANQEPFDPALNDAYLGADWPPPWRAMRIAELLRSNASVTVDDMQRYQLDPGTPRADLFARAFLDAAARLADAGATDTTLARAAALLGEWDRRYTRENTRAVLFELAMRELRTRVWDEMGPDAPSPGEMALWQLLQDPQSLWWDDRSTDAVENRDTIMAASLRAALVQALERYGAPDSDDWRWERRRHANIRHLLELESLSALDLPVQGGSGTLNPSSGGGAWGASWRMVVELGPEIAARTIYPGGQSGNPVSRYYDDRIPKWQDGVLDSVPFPRAPGELTRERVTAMLVLRPAER